MIMAFGQWARFAILGPGALPQATVKMAFGQQPRRSNSQSVSALMQPSGLPTAVSSPSLEPAEVASPAAGCGQC